jgi:type II secretory pathway pseudopilin PulG
MNFQSETFSKKKRKLAFIKLFIVIVVIAIICTIVFFLLDSQQKEIDPQQKDVDNKSLANRQNVREYCIANPGESILHGDVVYCDDYYNMWSITLDGGGTYQWKTSDTALPSYADGDCNNLTASDMEDYPACKACYDLEYAGFEEGWQLPSQDGRDGTYCAPGRELWNLGYETCSWNPNQCDSAQSSCQPSYDTDAVAAYYWSSTEHSDTGAWGVHFNVGYVYRNYKTRAKRVRCVLGQ